jgi:CspA family cold shock protein
MDEHSLSIADAIARELSGRTDVNELAKCVGFIRDNLDKALFFEYLDTIIHEGQSVVRSGRTLDYYRAIRQASHQHLASCDDPQTIAEILGWAVRLMRYYAVEDKLERAAPPLSRDASPSTSRRQTGQVKFFRQDQGYGFIQPDGGGQDVYVNQRDVAEGSLHQGQRVSYLAVPGRKGPQARDVQPV